MAPSAIIDTTENITVPPFEIEKVVNGCGNNGEHQSKDAEYLITCAFKKRLDELASYPTGEGEDEDAFFVADLGEVYRQHLRWKMQLPRITPFYAVKCNPDPQILMLLSKLGTGFDCASRAEIKQVLDLGIDSSRIIYAHPCKNNVYVQYAAANGVRQMTFDNADELVKIKKLFPDAELFLRILTDDSDSQCPLSQKFGASLDNTEKLLKAAKRLGLDVVGVSFHVGSGASDPRAFVRAVQDARVVFDQAEMVGFRLKTLDVGGGFSTDTFEAMAGSLNSALDAHIPLSVRVIAEPGRYYVATAFTEAANVIARREIEDPAGVFPSSYMLYLNDGVYGNFSCILYDHQQPVPQVLQAGGQMHYREAGESSLSAQLKQYSLWGPTCDGIDRIAERCTFPQLLDVGDWLYFRNMGAYTRCSATKFNGFTNDHQVVYISSEAGATALMGGTLMDCE
ncbi:MAG: Ornithine decarboxylase [Vezdaea aestivalis]|nr:MAG: Ornithine decarboxylase [Vezdaea aestivalis]